MSGSVAAVAADCWRESRPTVQVVFQLRFGLGFLLGGGTEGRYLAGGALVWLGATAAVYLLNGCTDVVGDRVNGSRRPIATGRLPAPLALRVAAGLGLVALAGAAALSPALLVLSGLFLALGIAYSVPPLAAKRFTGGAMVVGGLGGFITYLAGAAAARLGTVVVPTPAGFIAVTAGLLTAWMALVGGATKDLPDVAGDAAAGRRTLVARGETAARRFAAGSGLLIGVAAVLVALRCRPALALAAGVLLAGGVAVAASVLSGHSTGSRRRRERPYRIFMLTQYGTHACLLVTLMAS